MGAPLFVTVWAVLQRRTTTQTQRLSPEPNVQHTKRITWTSPAQVNTHVSLRLALSKPTPAYHSADRSSYPVHTC